ncbi:hypothetical protein BU14_0096s0002 [Porphyra umbilicalis]|uniref:Uncharacterized protein n=1 Tax=Porphyra umbilicalis TaxID=2786 RepID=A0A1X6PD59_PORUM|nr:hypothetical protein BU14_0096s0002 [Porphyra umbilicalis]|eukprot:OSX78849.1 hypothetical protein BU14_0096s0002 [Porphyra umbilicalis]
MPLPRGHAHAEAVPSGGAAVRVALPRAPTPPSGSATCALPCTCTVPFFAPAVSNAPAAPHSTDSAVGAVYCLLLNLPGPRRSLTPCCLPLRFPLAVWPPRSHLPKHGGRHKRQRRAAAGGLPPPVAVSWPPAGGWAAATANDITGRAATGGGVPGSHHAGRRASVVCGNRTAVAADAGAGPGRHARRRRRDHCQGHHRVRAAPPPRPVPIGAHAAAVGGGATPAGHHRAAAPATGVVATAGGGCHARHCHYARRGPVRLPRGAGLHDARDGSDDAAGGGGRQTAVRHWTPTAAAEGSLLFVRGWARRSGALVIPL